MNLFVTVTSVLKKMLVHPLEKIVVNMEFVGPREMCYSYSMLISCDLQN